MNENVPFTSLDPEAKRRFWADRYATGKTGWDRGGPSRALLAWLDGGALSPCRILIPGCGRGHEVVELARRGFDVTAVDYAEAALSALAAQLALQRLAATTFNADLLTFTPSHPFDAIYEQTALCALAPGAWSAYAGRLHDWLRAGGRLFVLFMQTWRDGGPPFHCDIARMRQLFAASRWEWPDEPFQSVPHSNGLFEIAAVLTRL